MLDQGKQNLTAIVSGRKSPDSYDTYVQIVGVNLRPKQVARKAFPGLPLDPPDSRNIGQCGG